MKRNFYTVVFCAFVSVLASLFYASAELSAENGSNVVAGTRINLVLGKNNVDNKLPIATATWNQADINLLLEALLQKEKEIEAEKNKNELLKKENESLKDEIEQLNKSVMASADLINKERASFLYDMGCIYRSAGFYKEAENAFLEALKLSPDDAYTHYNLAVLYEDDFNNKTAAKLHYLLYLELAPDDSDAAKVREWLEHLK